MKYIYDLKELDKLGPAHIPAAQVAALLAIAERLEALVKAQKPRWVEFELASGDMIVVNPARVSRVRPASTEDKDFSYLVFGEFDSVLEKVVGSYPEVAAKLKGDK